ncbi:type III-D CRISPR-associated protein Csx19 [Selenomonas ruminis]|uniref:TIGR03984 family CRISPR-associated protein n=1 Tax=Selenomonas ruminis TaxID=2593411 RepID=A0A5D6W7J8_9FIRM|nr:CRISPR-associated protein Csx19 [Selenomonas sp. mPRGC5]TYZ22929.1 TIGR03984 family CRISPR-associated protein [Selenomonas sp. mPRGC5]
MGFELAKNKLQKQDICSSRMPLVHIERNESALTELLAKKIKAPACLVVWALHAVTFGCWDGAKLTLQNNQVEIADIIEMRVFNAQEEVHLLQVDEYFEGRYICDDDSGSPQEVIDSFSRFWGECESPESVTDRDMYIELKDASRKLTLNIPVSKGSKGGKYYGLTTRNYIGYDRTTGLAGYADQRFVSIDALKEV